MVALHCKFITCSFTANILIMFLSRKKNVDKLLWLLSNKCYFFHETYHLLSINYLLFSHCSRKHLIIINRTWLHISSVGSYSNNFFLAELQEIDVAKNWPCKSGRIPKTLRFDPLTSKTSGLFVAKFTKLAIWFFLNVFVEEWFYDLGSLFIYCTFVA